LEPEPQKNTEDNCTGFNFPFTISTWIRKKWPKVGDQFMKT